LAVLISPLNSLEVKGARSLIDLNTSISGAKSALQHAFLALQQQFCFKRRRQTFKVSLVLGGLANNHRIDSN
jgi:hypothetical protein